MKDIRKDWFYSQWFSKEELEKLWNWIETSGNKAVAIKNSEERWQGFLVADTNKEIELVIMDSQEMCNNWLIRLGLTI